MSFATARPFDNELLGHRHDVGQTPLRPRFRGSRLDQPVDFPEEVMEAFWAEKEAQFGDDWDRAKEVVWALESFGIYLTDISPSNIALHAIPD
ncbi:MAG: hypothetical protein R3F11_14500 [Verrucomicrobiales bacterium]